METPAKVLFFITGPVSFLTAVWPRYGSDFNATALVRAFRASALRLALRRAIPSHICGSAAFDQLRGLLKIFDGQLDPTAEGCRQVVAPDTPAQAGDGRSGVKDLESLCRSPPARSGPISCRSPGPARPGRTGSPERGDTSRVARRQRHGLLRQANAGFGGVAGAVAVPDLDRDFGNIGVGQGGPILRAGLLRALLGGRGELAGQASPSAARSCRSRAFSSSATGTAPASAAANRPVPGNQRILLSCYIDASLRCTSNKYRASTPSATPCAPTTFGAPNFGISAPATRLPIGIPPLKAIL